MGRNLHWGHGFDQATALSFACRFSIEARQVTPFRPPVRRGARSRSAGRVAFVKSSPAWTIPRASDGTCAPVSARRCLARATRLSRTTPFTIGRERRASRDTRRGREVPDRAPASRRREGTRLRNRPTRRGRVQDLRAYELRHRRGSGGRPASRIRGGDRSGHDYERERNRSRVSRALLT
jgi:hypothetical protein